MPRKTGSAVGASPRRLRVLIAPDKFKGTLSARAAAEAIARGWREARPDDELTLVPISDGGDGFGLAISELTSAKARRVRTVDAAHRPQMVSWWWDETNATAIVESARVIGLALLPTRKFHPFELDTFGLGKLFRSVAAAGPKCCLVGIGGSATNDGGFGLARAVGWQFDDAAGKPIERWKDLVKLRAIRPPKETLSLGELVIAVDVQNPLLGPNGATRIYGPQKGLGQADFALAEQCLGRLADVWETTFHRKLRNDPGTGAAGGLGFGLRAFLSGRLKRGFDLFSRAADLEKRLASTDLVITGEGSIDLSTLMGKGVGEVMRKSRKRGIPCIGLAGRAPGSQRARREFSRLHALTEVVTPVQAEAQAARCLQELAKRVSEEWP